MIDPILPQSGSKLVNDWLCARAVDLRSKDEPARSLPAWQMRKQQLRDAMFAAMGAFPEQPCDLEPKLLGTLERDDYRIEKLIFQSRPNVWITANAYVPNAAMDGGKVPAVLVVHGHWSWARRDPVVQSRCLGLVKQNYFVLAIDAFGAGERFINPARGTYHGALYGSTLWPTGQSLLGMQVYDNRRAVDYLLSRREVNGKLGITGASGGGNQSMYAGALDERIEAVVPVCSVGNYQAYLKAACCVCEVLPGALRFTEEGDVLGLVAPRALLVINAAKDAYQFAPAQAEKSIERAKTVFALHGAPDRLKHTIIDSGHDYNQAMREVMYGWMARFLKGKGTGEPIPEPKITLETPEDLACFPKEDRPKAMLFPPSFAAQTAKTVLSTHDKKLPTHPQEWEATSLTWRRQITEFLQLGKLPNPVAKTGKATSANGLTTVPVILSGEDGLPIPLALRSANMFSGKTKPCIILHLDGKAAALDHPLAKSVIGKGWEVIAPDLRGCGETRYERDAIGGAPDHNSAEHAIWIGRPMLGQWLTDVQAILQWVKLQRTPELMVVGIGPASVLAYLARTLPDNGITRVISVAGPGTLVSDTAYVTGTPMGLLAPGLFRIGDVPHFASMVAPVPLTIAQGGSPQGGKYTQLQLEEAYRFTRGVYQAIGAANRLRLFMTASPDELSVEK